MILQPKGGDPQLAAAIADAGATVYLDLCDRRWAEWRLYAEQPAAAIAAGIDPLRARVRVGILRAAKYVPRPDACRRLAAEN